MLHALIDIPPVFYGISPVIFPLIISSPQKKITLSKWSDVEIPHRVFHGGLDLLFFLFSGMGYSIVE
jgi:hypothetical protein